jgi:two-component system copper resistance phosphate regulon response regulator CusR
VNILLVEDDVNVSGFIKKGLEEQGYNITVAYDGLTGKYIAVEKDFDVVLLDVMLPQFNGLEVCKLHKAVQKGYTYFNTHSPWNC